VTATGVIFKPDFVFTQYSHHSLLCFST